MKNRGIICLLLIGCIFCAGMLGFYIGRNTAGERISVSDHSPETPKEPQLDPTDPGTTAPLMVNINTATLEELQRLPGIGPTLAQRIIDYREDHGPFEAVSQLTMVEGIGILTLEEIMEYVTVGG